MVDDFLLIINESITLSYWLIIQLPLIWDEILNFVSLRTHNFTTFNRLVVYQWSSLNEVIT